MASKELLKTTAGAQLLCRSLDSNSHQSWSYVLQGRHDAQGGGSLEGVPELGIVSKWRQKERLKTTAVALVLCLNIGVDPPDVIKISPCARLECWVDPLSMQPPKALETIGTRPLTHTCIRCKPFNLHSRRIAHSRSALYLPMCSLGVLHKTPVHAAYKGVGKDKYAAPATCKWSK